MPDDSIRFTLSAEQVVVNTTVKIIANVVAMVTPDLVEAKLNDSIREVMQNFIEADWQFSGMNRSPHAAGLEQVSVVATARVAESQNYALDQRRQKASREGLSIASVRTDTSPAISQIEETQSKLRQQLLRNIKAELESLCDVMGADYRIGKVVFDDGSEPQGGGRAMMAANSASYGTGFGADGTLGNAVKLTMQAHVTLRR